MLTSELLDELIASRFSNPILDRMDDSAVLPAHPGRLAFTTDSYVVSPVFFPGGNIGDLAVCGTVNDLAMSGAVPKYVSLALILEEGLAVSDLEKILDAARDRAEGAGVQIVCGDTKVVPKGQADSVYINTSGIGVIPEGVNISAQNALSGDRLIVSGQLGLHGMAVMLARGNFNLETPIKSDVAPLNGIVAAMLDEGVKIRALRDLTRGGLAMAMLDLAKSSNVTVEVEEVKIPLNETQKSACDILGLDVLNIPSEGCFMAVVDPADAESAVGVMRRFPVAADAAVIGAIGTQGRYPLELITSLGSRRIITPPRGEQMPRIC